MAILNPKAVPFTGPRLLALARAVHRSRGHGLYDGLLLQGIACEALHNIYKEGGYSCPRCLLIWATAERRDACPHAGKTGTPVQDQATPGIEDTMRHWLKMAEVERWPG